MSPGYDPSKPRKNPELKAILRAIERGHDALKAAATHAQKRGEAMVLQGCLEAFLDEPEFLLDLRDGALAPREQTRLDPSAFPAGAAPFLEEGAFDQAGAAEGVFFFYTSGGAISPLYSGSALDPYDVGGPLYTCGPFVYALEKRYASAKPTIRHVSSEWVFRKLVRQSKPPIAKSAPHFVIADPAGLGTSACLVKAFRDLRRAKASADRLGERLDIRFAVATVRFSLCTR